MYRNIPNRSTLCYLIFCNNAVFRQLAETGNFKGRSKHFQLRWRFLHHFITRGILSITTVKQALQLEFKLSLVRCRKSKDKLESKDEDKEKDKEKQGRRAPATAALVDEPSLRAVVTKALADGLAAYLCASEKGTLPRSLRLRSNCSIAGGPGSTCVAQARSPAVAEAASC